MKRRSLLRSFSILAAASSSSAVALAQTAPVAVPIGKWLGAMQGGFGDITLTVTGTRANGKVAGQLSFSGANYTFVFGDAVDKAAKPEVGTAEMVDGELVVTAPQGGIYKFRPGKTQLHGTFSRGPLVGTLTLDKAR